MEPKAYQILWSPRVHVGKESGSLNINIATEVSRIKKNKLGLMDERGRDITEVQVCAKPHT